MENDYDLKEKLDNGVLQLQCLCRCCSKTNGKLKPIFSPNGSIPEAVFLFTAVKFEEDDKLPASICTTCLDHLNNSINFKRKVETVDLIFRKYLSECLQNTLSKGESTADFEEQREHLKEHDYTQSNETIEDLNSMKSNETTQLIEGKDKTAIATFCHIDNPKESSFRCPECRKKFMDKTAFDHHRICHTQKNSFAKDINRVHICLSCEDRFDSEHDLFVHSSLHDSANEYTCKACSKNFLTHRKLKRHIPTHFLSKPCKCQVCGMGFAEMASLSRHYKVHTKTREESHYLCLVCKKGFRNRYDLKVHNRNHTGERPWKCTTCTKQFTDFRLLNSHLKLHQNDKPFECKQCKKRFRHKSTLVNHTRTHFSNKPHRCNKCKKSYKQLWSLELHQQTHAVKKHFLCDRCSQVFSSVSSLEDHMRWHNNDIDEQKEKPSEFFQCNECSAQFTSPLDLITHRKLTHSLRHECETCFGKWKTLEELVQHKCNEAVKLSDEPTPDEMILLPNGEILDCNSVVNSLLASVCRAPTTPVNEKKANKKNKK